MSDISDEEMMLMGWNPTQIVFVNGIIKELAELKAWKEENDSVVKELREQLEISANQLEGLSIAIRCHGQNINTDFFIIEYKKMADEKRKCLKKVDAYFNRELHKEEE